MVTENPREHSQSIQSIFLSYSKRMSPENSLTLASGAKRLDYRASKRPKHKFQEGLRNIQRDMLSQETRSLMLQIRRKHAIYLPYIGEMPATF